ncbi:hypothetical protein PFDG_04990 [Plasmodium falciparum Dd2]|uniref:Uncharacterized protein n=1 Tax=Plasmodium falciparum (isolate Dd2) TaxID=57267 RepID=A0A0L7M9E3_PLAF4|nr:hypothetical protein PFDG_04990 [Plasmodium falciparum Dd2]
MIEKKGTSTIKDWGSGNYDQPKNKTIMYMIITPQSQHCLTNNNMPEYLEQDESEDNTAKHTKEEEIIHGNRQFLTETKYYKRGTYSKAGIHKTEGS